MTDIQVQGSGVDLEKVPQHNVATLTTQRRGVTERNFPGVCGMDRGAFSSAHAPFLLPP